MHLIFGNFIALKLISNRWQSFHLYNLSFKIIHFFKKNYLLICIEFTPNRELHPLIGLLTLLCITANKMRQTPKFSITEFFIEYLELQRPQIEFKCLIKLFSCEFTTITMHKTTLSAQNVQIFASFFDLIKLIIIINI